MNSIIEDIIDHINKAKLEAIKRNIKINQIIIDKDLAMTNHIYFKNVDGNISEANPMILGLSIKYQENLKQDGYNFIIDYNENLDKKPKTLADYTEEELLQELLRRKTNGI